MLRDDKIIQCKDCGKNFVFRTFEQEFYAENNYSEPTRCKDCRAARKNTGVRQTGAPRSPASQGGAQPAKEMFTVACASCGKPAKVPFKPSGGKPVYCSDCFSKQSGRGKR